MRTEHATATRYDVAQLLPSVGITGMARRLVMDGALEESAAREAMAAASAERKPRSARLPTPLWRKRDCSKP